MFSCCFRWYRLDAGGGLYIIKGRNSGESSVLSEKPQCSKLSEPKD
jgi:hypothetical protein